MRRRLAALYPLWWRDRYRDEFEALLDDAPPRWTDGFDILKEALPMRVRSLNSWQIAGGCAVLGAMLALTGSYALPRRFVSSAVMQPVGDSLMGDRAIRVIQQVLSTGSLAPVIVRNGLYEEMRKSAPLEDVAGRMRKDIRIGSVLPSHGPAAGAISLSFEYVDPAKARATARDLSVQLAAQTGAYLIDGPNLPDQPVFPNRKTIAMAGVLAGALLGMAGARLARASSARKAT